MRLKEKLAKKKKALHESRRKFLKQTLAFAAITSTYSVISLTQLACQSDSPSGSGTPPLYY